MIVYENYVTENRYAFVEKVIKISQNLGVNPNWLMSIMKSESGLNHRIVNSIGCVGLIQFCGNTPAGLGTSAQALVSMSNVEQLDYVEKFYLQAGKNKFKSFADLYLFAFYPLAIYQNKPDSFIIGSEQSDAYARLVTQQNKIFDVDNDGYVTVANFKKYIADKYGDGSGSWSNYAVTTTKYVKKNVFTTKNILIASIGTVCITLLVLGLRKK